MHPRPTLLVDRFGEGVGKNERKTEVCLQAARCGMNKGE